MFVGQDPPAIKWEKRGDTLETAKRRAGCPREHWGWLERAKPNSSMGRED